MGGGTFKTPATLQSHLESRPHGLFAAGRRLSSRSQRQQKGFVKQKSLVVLAGAAEALMVVVVGRLGWLGWLGRRVGRWSGGTKGGKHGHCQSCKSERIVNIRLIIIRFVVTYLSGEGISGGLVGLP